jgi:hypothetical protein
MKCCIDSKAPSNFTPNPRRYFFASPCQYSAKYTDCTIQVPQCNGISAAWRLIYLPCSPDCRVIAGFARMQPDLKKITAS